MLETALRDPGGPIEVVAYVDEDDPSLHLYRALQEQWAVRAPEVMVSLIVGDRIVISVAWNRCAEMASGELLMLAADDIRFHNDGWAGAVHKVFDGIPDRIAYVYGRDGIHDHRLGTHGVIHRRWMETVGYFAPPHFTSDYNDAWLHEVARMVGRAFYLPALVTEHLHPAVGKAKIDQTHKDRGERALQHHVHELYAGLADLRWADANKLLEVMNR